MKKIFSLALLVATLMANDFGLGEEISSFTLADQFEKDHIVSFEKDTGADMNEFLNTKNPKYLEERNAVFIANISKMPGIITKLFAMPKMKKYKHTILLINDEEDKRFAQEEEKITVYKLKNGVIEKINFVSSAQEVAKNL
jgi:hypothetical protein